MRWTHITAGAVAMAGLVMLTVSVVRFWPQSRQQAAEPEDVEPIVTPEPAVLEAKYPLSAAEGAQAVADSIAGSIEGVDGVDPAVIGALRDQTRAAIPAYLSERLADFNAYLATMGVAPINDGGDPRQWMAYRRCFADARFDPASVVVVRRTRGIAVTPVPEHHHSVRLTERPTARPEWAKKPPQSYEVRVKGLFHAYAAGSPVFEATMGLEFAYDPMSGDWMLIRSYLYDVPDGIMVIDPPV